PGGKQQAQSGYTLRAFHTQRTLADGLQRALRHRARTLPPLDGARRSFAVLDLLKGLLQRANRYGATPSGGKLSHLRAAVADHYRQRIALGRRAGEPLHAAGGVAAALGHRDQPQPALPSADARQGRALPSQPQSRGSFRPSLCGYRALPTRLRRLARDLQPSPAPSGTWNGGTGETIQCQPKD